MASVLLRPEERPAVPFEPNRLLLAIATEYEALRALLRDRRDIDAAVIVAQARSCARSLLQFARAVRRAERPALVRGHDPIARGDPATLMASATAAAALKARPVRAADARAARSLPRVPPDNAIPAVAQPTAERELGIWHQHLRGGGAREATSPSPERSIGHLPNRF